MIVVGVSFAHEGIVDARHSGACDLDFVDVVDPVGVGQFVDELNGDVAAGKVRIWIGDEAAR